MYARAPNKEGVQGTQGQTWNPNPNNALAPGVTSALSSGHVLQWLTVLCRYPVCWSRLHRVHVAFAVTRGPPAAIKCFPRAYLRYRSSTRLDTTNSLAAAFSRHRPPLRNLFINTLSPVVAKKNIHQPKGEAKAANITKWGCSTCAPLHSSPARTSRAQCSPRQAILP